MKKTKDEQEYLSELEENIAWEAFMLGRIYEKKKEKQKSN